MNQVIQDTTATNTPATPQTQRTTDPQEPEVPETTEKEPKYSPKTLETIRLVSAGADPRTALQISNNKSNIADVTVNKFKAKYKKYTLTHPKLLKTASSQVSRILSGEARAITQQKVTKSGQVVNYTETIAPSDTNILAAAAMVYDRFEPVKQPEAPGGGLAVSIRADERTVAALMSLLPARAKVEENAIDVTPEPRIDE
jgi:hypothetical protein